MIPKIQICRYLTRKKEGVKRIVTPDRGIQRCYKKSMDEYLAENKLGSHLKFSIVMSHVHVLIVVRQIFLKIKFRFVYNFSETRYLLAWCFYWESSKSPI